MRERLFNTHLDLVLWLAVFAGAARPSFAQAQALPSHDSIRTDMSAASARYIATLADYQCEQTDETRAINSQDIVFRSSARCRQSGELGLMILTSSGAEPEPSRAIGVNSRYSFEVRKDPGKQWVLVDYGELGSQPREVFPYLGTEVPICRGLAPYWLDEGTWLPDLFGQGVKNARLRPTGWVAQGGASVLRVEFEYPHRHSPGVTFKGQVDLVPARSWVVLGWVSEMTRGGVTRRTVLEREFAPADDPVPLPLRERRTVTSSTSGGRGRETVMEYKWAKEKADPSEFRLTAFGLPEPPGVKWDRPTPTYVWVLLAAAVTAALAAGFRYLARRRANPTPPAGQA
jgi:hypothetical protein